MAGDEEESATKGLLYTPEIRFYFETPKEPLRALERRGNEGLPKRDRVHWRHIVGSGVEATEVEMILFKDISHTGSSCAPHPPPAVLQGRQLSYHMVASGFTLSLRQLPSSALSAKFRIS